MKKLSKNQLHKLINEELEIITTNHSKHEREVMEENWGAIGKWVGKGLMFLLTKMMSSADGRKTLSSILLAIPNLIDSLCDANFATDVNGEKLGNLKTKLCKTMGYAAGGPIFVALKIAGEIVALMDDNTAKEIVKEVESNKKKNDILTPQPSNEMMPNIDMSNLPPGYPGLNVNPIPYDASSSVDDMTVMEAAIDRKMIRQMILKELSK